MGLKIKRMVCIACAFITSFLLTVTAYSAVLGEGDITNPNYLGKYTNENIPGYIWAKDGNLVIYAYEDDNYKCFVTGSVGSYVLKSGLRGFEAVFPNAARVQLNGDLAAGNIPLIDYRALGDVSEEAFLGYITKVKIASFQSSLVYVYKR